ncbi:general secretion pathway protein C [Natronocella acetinitrilica]|uniref:General secretion pathway protein C n=1 Tax=Natronocella acetinitrilica TaxID=414046 RepID=A0AAE3FZZ6_9GAMM|nr:type II secretion system protein GspC [Natronocella acetinitrilica]MCP1673030.1 general secretion pathway protein C [Natronocella acetinitrilica]
MQGISTAVRSALSGTGSRVGVVAGTVVLVVALAYTLAELTWQLLPVEQSAAPPPAARQESPSSSSDRPSAGDTVAALRLFGAPGALNGGSVRQIPVDAPDTRLNLTLRGVLYDPGDQLARVIIATGGRNEDVYRVGDELTGGATIDAIMQDRVILLREGRHETLRLPEDQIRGGTPVALDTLPGGAPEISEDNVGIDDAGTGMDDDMRQTLLQNPDDFTRYVQPQPYMVDGEFRGFRLQAGSDPQVMQSVGLEAGDIVTEINGQLLDNPQVGIATLRDAAEQNRLDLTILRDGATRTITIEFDN